MHVSKGYVKNRGESVICKPRWGASKETNLADTFIWDIQLEELWGKKTNKLFKQDNQWYFSLFMQASEH